MFGLLITQQYTLFPLTLLPILFSKFHFPFFFLHFPHTFVYTFQLLETASLTNSPYALSCFPSFKALFRILFFAQLIVSEDAVSKTHTMNHYAFHQTIS